MHPKHRLVWLITSPIALGIIGVWAFNFRHELGNLGSDPGLHAITDSLRGTALQTDSSLQDLQKSFDAQSKALNNAFATQSAEAAAVDSLKAKVDAAAKAKQQTSHLEPSATNENVNATKKK